MLGNISVVKNTVVGTTLGISVVNEGKDENIPVSKISELPDGEMVGVSSVVDG